MKAKEVEILVVPGYTNSGPDHWQTRWESRLSTARRVEQAEWSKPVRQEWVDQLVAQANAAEKPIVFIAHSLGIPTVIHAVERITKPIAGAFFVAPPDVDNETIRPKHLKTFGPYPREKLPFPSVTIISRNDPFSAYEIAESVANDWGSKVIDAGEIGHINADSGHGPWPEGTLAFATFLSSLKAAD